MKKVKLGPQTLLYPMPAVLVGAEVKGKPNFMTANKVDPTKIDPLIYSTVARQYQRLGAVVGRAWDVGKKTDIR